LVAETEPVHELNRHEQEENELRTSTTAHYRGFTSALRFKPVYNGIRFYFK
jgi:hypothetical protein